MATKHEFFRLDKEKGPFESQTELLQDSDGESRPLQSPSKRDVIDEQRKKSRLFERNHLACAIAPSEKKQCSPKEKIKERKEED